MRTRGGNVGSLVKPAPRRPPALFSVEGTLVKKNNETLKLHMHARSLSLLDGCFAEGGAHYGRHACGAVAQVHAATASSATRARSHTLSCVVLVPCMTTPTGKKNTRRTSVDFACGASLYDRSTSMDARRRCRIRYLAPVRCSASSSWSGSTHHIT